MGYPKRKSNQRSARTIGEEGRPGERPTEPSSEVDRALRRVQQFVATGNYQRAVDLLASAGHDRRVLNARGVCLMRLGRVDEAARLYYGLVLKPGCTWMRPEAPTVHKLNYATALFLSGHPSGCREVLAEINDEQHPEVQRLRAAMKNWESQLTFWQKINWRLARIDPATRPVVGFEAGAFEQLPIDEGHSPVRPPGSTRAA